MSYATTPSTSSVGRWARICLCLAALGYLALAARLVQLQHGERADDASRKVVSQTNTVSRWSPQRGVITDRNGQALAISKPVYSCALDPKLVDDLPATVETIRKAIDLTPAELDNIYTRAEAEGSRFVWVRRQLTDAHAEALKQVKTDGVILQQEYKRLYPQNQLGAHLIGFTDIDGNGLEGIEHVCNAILKGISSTTPLLRDARNHKLMPRAEQIPESRYGLTVEMSLDSAIQLIAEEELVKAAREYNAKSACAMVMDPNTGDILALVNYPSYDLNRPGLWPVSHRMNQCISTIIEPGSTFKPVVMAAALEAGKVRPTSSIFCNHGSWRMNNGRVLHDAHGYGLLSAEGVLVKSSNIGMAKIALQMGAPMLHAAVTRFGFGEETGVPLPGELSGKIYPLAKWTSYSMGSVPMGQEVAVTPIQLVSAYAALANGGNLLKPRIVRCIRKPDGEIVYDVPVTVRRRALHESVARTVRGMLRNVVEDGTGKRVEMDEYELGGKTGTAQLPVNTAEYAEGQRGYSKSRYVSNFVAIAPYDNPRIVVFVGIREPHGAHYGGVVAGPAVREIARRTLFYLSEPTRQDLALGNTTGGRQ